MICAINQVLFAGIFAGVFASHDVVSSDVVAGILLLAQWNKRFTNPYTRKQEFPGNGLPTTDPGMASSKPEPETMSDLAYYFKYMSPFSGILGASVYGPQDFWATFRQSIRCCCP
jgi:hypothetical protein